MVGQDRNFAQGVSLTPPPKHRQFATERVRARIKERMAQKTLERALERDVEPGERAYVRSLPIEAARIWNLLSLRELREALPQREQERLRAQLDAVLCGECSPEVWRRTLIALAELRRASELPIGAPLRWRQTWPSLEDG
jgi:hypothetical protein